MRVAIVGNSGSGKTTAARALAERHRLAMLDLDTVAWQPGREAEPRAPAEAERDLRAFCEASEAWVVEGCYAALTRAALAYRPVLLFLDPGVEACIAHCRSRPWEPHKYASKRAQDARLDSLLAWVRDYYERDGDLSHGAHRALFDAYGGPKRKLTRPVELARLDEILAEATSGREPVR